jgi:hypothetical protein
VTRRRENGALQPGRRWFFAAAIFFAALSQTTPRAGAISVTLVPAADTSLIEVAPTNNNGGQEWLLCGRTQNGPRNRALFRFDLSNIPTGAVIQYAALTLEVTRVPDEPPVNSTFGLHRMLRPWGEGNKAATGATPPGRGLPADPGEATWLSAFHPTNAWSAPGAAEGADFSSVESSFQFITGVDTYLFDSTPELVGDVQDWVNHPESNYGWLLLCNDEGSIFSARRFASREDPNAPPQLVIEYTVPLRIDGAWKAGDEFTLSFLAQPGLIYTVEYCDAPGANAWQPLAFVWTPTEARRFEVVDTASAPQRFYRLTIAP